MVVYLAAYGYSCEGDTVVGVFSTQDKAWEHLFNNYSKFGDTKTVTQWEVDVGE
jgi:hypothetical protein